MLWSNECGPVYIKQMDGFHGNHGNQNINFKNEYQMCSYSMGFHGTILLNLECHLHSRNLHVTTGIAIILVPSVFWLFFLVIWIRKANKVSN